MSNRREHRPNVHTILTGPSEPGVIQRASLPVEEPAEVPSAPAPAEPSPQPPARAAKQPVQESQPKRTKIGYGLRDDLIRDFKQIALDQEKKIYEVIEDALVDYLKRYAKKHPDARLKSRLDEK